MKNSSLYLGFSILLLIVGFGYFIFGTGLIVPKGVPTVTGLNFVDAVSYNPSQGYVYRQDGTMQILIRDVANFDKDRYGFIWVDMNLRITNLASNRRIISMNNVLDESGKTRIFTDSISPVIKIPLTLMEAGKYVVEVDVMDRNAGEIVSTFSNVITVTR